MKENTFIVHMRGRSCDICVLMVLTYVALTMCETHWAAVENSRCDFYIALSQ